MFAFCGCAPLKMADTSSFLLEYDIKAVGDYDDKSTKYTFAECERKCYEAQYVKKKNELKDVYNEFVEKYQKVCRTDHPQLAEERLQKMAEQEYDFERFLNLYAEKNACLYCRSSAYHYYGSLIDMINLRIKHLKIHIDQIS
jgi:hypothetical protein